jgi:hypothetical protein
VGVRLGGGRRYFSPRQERRRRQLQLDAELDERAEEEEAAVKELLSDAQR